MRLSQFNFILFLFVACLWSGSFVGIKAVVMVWPPLFGAAMRVSIALLAIFALVVCMRQKTKIPFASRWKLWVIGIFAQGIPFTFLFWGERYVSPGLAGILNATVPIWTFIFALIFMNKSTTFSLLKTLGLLIGISGIVSIFWPMLTFDHNVNTLLGAGSVLIMAMSYASAGLLNQIFLKGEQKVDFLANVYHQHWGSVTFLLVLSLLLETWPSISVLQSSYLPWLSCLYLGVFATALAFVIYYHLIREWDAVRASSVLYVVPVLALLWDFLFFGNNPTHSEIIGVATILLGVTLIQVASLVRRPQLAMD